MQLYFRTVLEQSVIIYLSFYFSLNSTWMFSNPKIKWKYNRYFPKMPICILFDKFVKLTKVLATSDKCAMRAFPTTNCNSSWCVEMLLWKIHQCFISRVWRITEESHGKTLLPLIVSSLILNFRVSTDFSSEQFRAFLPKFSARQHRKILRVEQFFSLLYNFPRKKNYDYFLEDVSLS